MIPSAMNMHTYLDGPQDRQGSYTFRPVLHPRCKLLPAKLSRIPTFSWQTPTFATLSNYKTTGAWRQGADELRPEAAACDDLRPVWCLSASSICKWRLAFSSTCTEMIYKYDDHQADLHPRRPGDGCGVLLIRDALKGARHQSFVFSGLRY